MDVREVPPHLPWEGAFVFHGMRPALCTYVAGKKGCFQPGPGPTGGRRRNPGWLLVGGATSVSRGIHGYIYIHSYYGKYLQHLAPFFLSIGHLLPDITQYIIRRMIPLVLRG